MAKVAAFCALFSGRSKGDVRVPEAIMSFSTDVDLSGADNPRCLQRAQHASFASIGTVEVYQRTVRFCVHLACPMIFGMPLFDVRARVGVRVRNMDESANEI